MTPAARLAAAAAIIDAVLDGTPGEQALTRWARSSRFAGSSDRAAVRDHVFSGLRCLRSYAALGGARSGRGVMLGLLRAAGEPVESYFNNEKHALEPLSYDEFAAAPSWGALAENVVLDCPDWLAPQLRASLGDDFAAVMAALRERAPVVLRVNLRKATRVQAQAALAQEHIATRPNALSPTALEVVENPRRVAGSRAYRDGQVELQDAASQAAADMLPVRQGDRVLDYCAGGGGKSLALAARVEADQFAFDIAPERMRDLPARAARAGARITPVAAPAALRDMPRFDLVFCDAPCSGSGAWRRSPEAKWRLDQARLDTLLQTQSAILDAAADLVAPGGVLAYLTCSLLACENGDRVDAFLATHSGWRRGAGRRFTPLDGGDGFFVALLHRV